MPHTPYGFDWACLLLIRAGNLDSMEEMNRLPQLSRHVSPAATLALNCFIALKVDSRLEYLFPQKKKCKSSKGSIYKTGPCLFLPGELLPLPLAPRRPRWPLLFQDPEPGCKRRLASQGHIYSKRKCFYMHALAFGEPVPSSSHHGMLTLSQEPVL